VERIHAAVVLEELLEKFSKDCAPQETPNNGTGQKLEMEAAAEMNSYGLTTTPFPSPLSR